MAMALFSHAGAQAFCNSYFGVGSGDVLISGVNCSGIESGLINCTHNGIGNHNCNHTDDAGVTCLGLWLGIILHSIILHSFTLFLTSGL